MPHCNTEAGGGGELLPVKVQWSKFTYIVHCRVVIYVDVYLVLILVLLQVLQLCYLTYVHKTSYNNIEKYLQNFCS